MKCAAILRLKISAINRSGLRFLLYPKASPFKGNLLLGLRLYKPQYAFTC